VSESIEVNVVRVFTTESGELGNKLGIVWASDATHGREQQLAASIGFSETVFIESVLDGVATVSIFTPATELPFAGHPSVGTAWWLKQQGMPVDSLAERAGAVAVRYDDDLTWITGRAEWTPSFIWRPLATPADVDALDPDTVADGPDYAYAWMDQSAGALRSRMFAPHLGVREDEATGAAAVAITARLARNLEITQGRGSRIHTTLLADGFVEVGGRTVADEPFTV
jgi:predicted PhzF superfamily epimerase YddE/YHI9